MTTDTISPTVRAGTHSTAAIATSVAPVVFIVDQDGAVRDSLELLVEAAGWTAETFMCADDFLARPRTLVPSCLVLDITHQHPRGIDLQARVSGERPDMPIIVITAFGDVPTSVQAMKAGAIEFLIKPFSADLMKVSIEHALERSRRAVQQTARLTSLRECYTLLTRREREVMTLVASGLLNKQVGGELGISEITVKAHRGQVMKKMNANSLPALVHMASSLGLTAAMTQ